MSITPVPENINALKAQINQTIEQGKDQPLDDVKQSVYGCLFRYARKHHKYEEQVQELASGISEPATEQYLNGCPEFVPISATMDTASQFIDLDGVQVLVDEKYITDDLKAALERIDDSLRLTARKPRQQDQ